jgi:Recombination endonuclease VII
MAKLGRKSSKLQLSDLHQDMQDKILHDYLFEKKSAAKIHRELEIQYAKKISHPSIYSFLKKTCSTRNRSDAAKSIVYNEVRVCKHCKKTYKIINPAQVYCRICCPTSRAYDRLKNYDISQFEFDALVQKQNNLCALCNKVLIHGGATNLNIDHCHKTNRVRGLLCHCCNMTVGFIESFGNHKDCFTQIGNYLDEKDINR